jgi:hypothetical protein
MCLVNVVAAGEASGVTALPRWMARLIGASTGMLGRLKVAGNSQRTLALS